MKEQLPLKRDESPRNGLRRSHFLKQKSFFELIILFNLHYPANIFWDRT